MRGSLLLILKKATVRHSLFDWLGDFNGVNATVALGMIELAGDGERRRDAASSSCCGEGFIGVLIF
jgi:hypothetical protein